MRRRWPWIILAILFVLMLLAASCSVGALIGAALTTGGGAGIGSGDTVAIIPVEGTIQSGESSGSLFNGGAYSGSIRNHLKKAQADPSVRAVILQIDSPGGGVTASEEIHDEVIRTQRDFKKKVVVLMESLAASGGYYISAPADRIVAHKSSLTGSIGVISIIPNVEGLLEMVGVKVTVFKSGPHKDETSGLRPMTEEEEAIQQRIVDEIYNQFVDVVAEGRKMDREAVLTLADGRVFTGSQAKNNGLVDELGSMEDAIRIAGQLAGIRGKPRVIEYGREGFLSSLLATMSGPAPQLSYKSLLGIEGQSGLQFIYLPTTTGR